LNAVKRAESVKNKGSPSDAESGSTRPKTAAPAGRRNSALKQVNPPKRVDGLNNDPSRRGSTVKSAKSIVSTDVKSAPITKSNNGGDIATASTTELPFQKLDYTNNIRNRNSTATPISVNDNSDGNAFPIPSRRGSLLTGYLPNSMTNGGQGLVNRRGSIRPFNNEDGELDIDEAVSRLTQSFRASTEIPIDSIAHRRGSLTATEGNRRGSYTITLNPITTVNENEAANTSSRRGSLLAPAITNSQELEKLSNDISNTVKTSAGDENAITDRKDDPAVAGVSSRSAKSSANSSSSNRRGSLISSSDTNRRGSTQADEDAVSNSNEGNKTNRRGSLVASTKMNRRGSNQYSDSEINPMSATGAEIMTNNRKGSVAASKDTVETKLSTTKDNKRPQTSLGRLQNNRRNAIGE
jgi:hypothetical protein